MFHGENGHQEVKEAISHIQADKHITDIKLNKRIFGFMPRYHQGKFPSCEMELKDSLGLGIEVYAFNCSTQDKGMQRSDFMVSLDCSWSSRTVGFRQ